MFTSFTTWLSSFTLKLNLRLRRLEQRFLERESQGRESERGDVPGWVLVVLMTTGLVTAIWAIAAPKLTLILRNALDAMNVIH